jgi:hypothetical protein
MSFTKTTTISALGGTLIVDFDADTTVAAHVTGNTTGTLYLVEVDNTANASTSAYLRIKDAQSAGSAGTLVPTWMFVAAPGKKASYALPEGQAYGTGLTLWCTSSNVAQNTTAPASAVIVRLIAS